MISVKKFFLLLFIGVSNITLVHAQPSIAISQPAPTFTTNDVFGRVVNLGNFKGHKVLLTFYRNVGCPVCNLRFHEVEQCDSTFKQKGLIVLAVYESSIEKMKQYVADDSYYSVMIPNPDESIYKMYSIARSTGKVMKGMFHGALGKARRGKRLFINHISQDGNANRISADFLIDENGIIVKAYYGKYLGDHLPMVEVLKFVNE